MTIRQCDNEMEDGRPKTEVRRQTPKECAVCSILRMKGKFSSIGATFVFFVVK